LDYARNGKEFVTASYDKTIRIFPVGEGKSREIYHTKRMQKYLIYNNFIRVYSILYSLDDKYIISGSDDTNIRFWKSEANDPIKIVIIS